MTCEQCRRNPAEMVLTYSDRCRSREKQLCRNCAQAPRIQGPYAVKPASPEKK